MDTENADAVEDAADIIQIGTRNMQNFSLLERVWPARKPVLAEARHVGHAGRMADGGRVCALRRQLPGHPLRARSADVFRPQPQHARPLGRSRRPRHCRTCRSSSIPATAPASATMCPMALAALAAGADGLLIEVHPDPDHALSDGAQSLDFASSNGSSFSSDPWPNRWSEPSTDMGPGDSSRTSARAAGSGDCEGCVCINRSASRRASGAETETRTLHP